MQQVSCPVLCLCMCVCVAYVCMCRALVKCLRFMLDIPHGVRGPSERDGWRGRYPSTGMDCSKSDPKSSLYNGGKWVRTMSGYIALKAVSFSVCLLHSARRVDTLHINCREREGEKKGRAGTGLLLGFSKEVQRWRGEKEEGGSGLFTFSTTGGLQQLLHRWSSSVCTLAQALINSIVISFTTSKTAKIHLHCSRKNIQPCQHC